MLMRGSIIEGDYMSIACLPDIPAFGKSVLGSAGLSLVWGSRAPDCAAWLDCACVMTVGGSWRGCLSIVSSLFLGRVLYCPVNACMGRTTHCMLMTCPVCVRMGHVLPELGLATLAWSESRIFEGGGAICFAKQRKV